MIYYSHVNEDSRVERELLQSSNCPSVLAIAGSGERVLALMDISCCKKLHVVDVNEEAIFLLQLKVAALTRFDVEVYLQFVGHLAATKEFRRKCFHRLQSQLPPACLQFWKARMYLVERGVLYAGQFERFLDRVRPFVTMWLGKSFLRILDQSCPKASVSSRRWKVVRWLFSQKWLYRLCGNKDVAFVGPGACLANIPAALEQIIQSSLGPRCFMAHLIFKGHLRNMAKEIMPPSLQKHVLKRVGERLREGDLSLDYYHADLADVMSWQTSAGPTLYSLSDILSFEDHGYLNDLLQNSAPNPKHIVVIRSFLRNRLGQAELDSLSLAYNHVAVHDAAESTGMYQIISLSERMPIEHKKNGSHAYTFHTV